MSICDDATVNHSIKVWNRKQFLRSYPASEKQRLSFYTVSKEKIGIHLGIHVNQLLKHFEDAMAKFNYPCRNCKCGSLC